jgi:hypothetical protein
MKTIIKTAALFLFSIIFSNNCNAQLKVQTNGTVKIGSETGWPDGGDLQIVQKDTTTEVRVFVTSSNIARFMAINSKYAYGIGIDEEGIGQIYGDIWSPSIKIISFNSNGNVSINTDPDPGNTFKLSIDGDAIITNGVWQSSDKSLKKDILPIEGAMEKLQKINGKTYHLIKDGTNQKNITTIRNRYGFIAQEVQEVFPDLVQVVNDSCKSLAINYDGFIPLLVEAFKKQQIIINNLENEVSLLKSSTTLTHNTESTNNKLYQNVPNPFLYGTQIDYNIESNTSNALINIYNLQGTQIKSYIVSEKGRAKIIIKGSELNPGIYLYTLIVDGEIIDTKQMVLTN